MSTQDIRKLSSVVRSIELIEEKTNIIHAQYTSAINENDKNQAIPIDDANLHLQLFFQHLEQLLQIDLKNRSFLLKNNNNKNYWNFFSLALKESKGLYDTILYVLNTQEVKTSTGRGRLFLRFCLQNHRLGDVIQQSFMMTKIVNQFYIDECFWTTPLYMNRIIQALYQLNDLQFDLLSKSQYQLDVCWPSIETNESFSKSLSNDLSRMKTESTPNDPSRMRNESTSSLLSMNSIDSELIVSIMPDSSNTTPPIFTNHESSINDESSTHSLSSTDDDPENTVNFWKEKYLQLEIQFQELQSTNSINDMEIQCSLDDPIEKELLINENEKFKIEINLLNEKNEQLQNEIDHSNKTNEQLNIETNNLNEKNEQLQNEIDQANKTNEQLNTKANKLKEKNEQLNTELNVLKEEFNNLNFQLSSISMKHSTAADKMKDYERDIAQYQTTIANKDILFNELQQKYNQLKSIEEKYLEYLNNQNKQNKRIELLEIEIQKTKKLLENERKSMDNERKEFTKAKEQLEFALQEKQLDFEEMKRRLVKSSREKAELFNSIHTYELQLQEQQSKKWIPDADVHNCMKCNVTFGWTVRKHHCRDCQKIFCNNCSNNWIPSSKGTNSHYRACDFCNEKLLKKPVTSSEVIPSVVYNNIGAGDNIDVSFEIRPERLPGTPDIQSTS